MQAIGVCKQRKSRYRSIADSNQHTDAAAHNLPGLRVVDEDFSRARYRDVSLFRKRARGQIELSGFRTHSVDHDAVAVFVEATGQVRDNQPTCLSPKVFFRVSRLGAFAVIER